MLEVKLQGYDPGKVTFLVDGFTFGFNLGFAGAQTARVSTNLTSALNNPTIVSEKLDTEVKCGRLAGPFIDMPLENFCVSQIGVVPKKQAGSFRIIHHLSYPTNGSINDGIPDCMATVHYASTDDAITILKRLGSGCIMSKLDIKSAFKIIPVHPNDHHLLGLTWENQFFYDKTLPMGCRSSCAIFEEFSTAVEWIANNELRPAGLQ